MGGGSSRRKLEGMLLTGSPALSGELPGPLGGVEGIAPGGATHVELRGG